MDWLRGEPRRPAPRDVGFWGELGYRVERALRRREQRIEQEQQRLAQFLSAIEASPNGVLLLDAQRPDRLVQLGRGRPLRARPAARPRASA